jgi:hypothetical protein
MKKKVVEPMLDFEAMPLKKGQRPPKGWKVARTMAACFPPGWPADKPYPCKCGCGHIMRVGGRFAYRNLKIVGFADKGYFDYAKTKASKNKPVYFSSPVPYDPQVHTEITCVASGSRPSPTARKRR